jgi:sugar fermentation stimulation protein A
MLFPPLIPGRLLRRYQRFFSDFELDDGQVVTAHCANPGSMKSILEHQPHGLLSRARPGRKLAFTWELAVLGNEGEKTHVYVNPAGANALVAEALDKRALPELGQYDDVFREVKINQHSRIDFMLQGKSGRTYVEVKNVTLSLGQGRAAFPDAVTTRGTKHLHELIALSQAGHRAVLLFCVARTDAHSVEAAGHIDPVYARTLAQAMDQGVLVLGYGGPIDQYGFQLSRRLPVISSASYASSQ